MENKKETPKVITQKLPLIKSTTSFKLHIPLSVEAKIRHLCSVVHDVEWSGTLFYKVKGSLDDGTFEATCVDLFVMDIGSSGYTEFKESSDIISYRIDNGLLEDGIMEGLIHSHNNMSTFFSTTDQSTLTEEGTNTNHFLSLIVNNEGTYTAGITRKVVTEREAVAHIKFTENKYYNTYGGEKVVLVQDGVTETDKKEVKISEFIEWFSLEIIKEEVRDSFRDIDSRLAEIRKSKKVSNTRSYYQQYPYNSSKGNPKGTEACSYKWPYLSQIEAEDDDADGVWGSNPNKGSKGYTGSIFPSDSQHVSGVSPSVSDFPLCLQESFDGDLVKKLCTQLLTGSIIINESSITLEDWVKKMDVYYEGRFGVIDADKHPATNDETLKANNSRLNMWVESIVEFLVYTKDEKLLSRLNISLGDDDYLFDESDTAEICAFDMYNLLYSLPESYVKEVMMNILTKYIPDGAFDYTTVK